MRGLVSQCESARLSPLGPEFDPRVYQDKFGSHVRKLSSPCQCLVVFPDMGFLPPSERFNILSLTEMDWPAKCQGTNKQFPLNLHKSRF